MTQIDNDDPFLAERLLASQTASASSLPSLKFLSASSNELPSIRNSSLVHASLAAARSPAIHASHQRHPSERVLSTSRRPSPPSSQRGRTRSLHALDKPVHQQSLPLTIATHGTFARREEYVSTPRPTSHHLLSFSVPNSISSVINTPVTSPYSGAHPSRCSPLSDMGHNSSGPSSNMQSMQPSPPVFNPSSNIAAPKKRILNLLKQEAQDELQTQQDDAARQPPPIQDSSITAQEKPISHVEDAAASSTLPIHSDIDSLAVDRHKKLASGFLINTTPSSSSTGTHSSTSSSSSSSRTHFTYENLPGTTTNPVKASETPSNSSFQWPAQISQFRRQLSQNLGYQTPCIVPATPYTPPPMLSPYRKGPGLYYQIFSQTTPQIVTPAVQPTATVATPFTPRVDDLSGPKINIGEDYQATIPQLALKAESTHAGMISIGLHRETNHQPVDRPTFVITTSRRMFRTYSLSRDRRDRAHQRCIVGSEFPYVDTRALIMPCRR